MRKSVTILLLPMFLLFIAPAHASPSTGLNFMVHSQQVNILETRTTADGITFFTANQSLTFTGGMIGSGTTIFSVIEQPSGNYLIHGTITFTGTVGNSKVGTAEFVIAGSGTFNPYTQQGHVTLGHGTGGLEGLHGQGKYQSSSPVDTTAEIPIHFDPS